MSDAPPTPRNLQEEIGKSSTVELARAGSIS